jgi:REP-associated tyrosine transposase
MERRELFKNKYRVPSIRYHNYDYSEDAAYFITICTKDRKPWFGEIHNRIMGLSEVGCDVNKYWHDIPIHFPFIILDTIIIMPDHIHGILIINKHLDSDYCPDFRRDAIHRVSNAHKTNINMQNTNVWGGDAMNRVSTVVNNPMLNPYSLSAVVRAFKSRVTHKVRQTHPNFQWQPRFYDRIVRDDREMDNIREYILYNPINSGKSRIDY